MRVVSYFTPHYTECARDLRHDLDNLGIRHKIWAKPSRGSWRLNCGMKARFILDELLDGGPVLWLDADARVRAPIPEPKDCDFAAWMIPARVMQPADQVAPDADGIAAGSMYFADTPEALEFVERWVEVERGQGKFEQVVLTELFYRTQPERLRTLRWHQGYCKVFDAPWFDGVQPLIVEHMQASRRLKHLA